MAIQTQVDDGAKGADEIPDIAREAHRILAMTDDGHDSRYTRTRSAAIQLAARTGAELILYDHAAESHFLDPYLGGPVASDNREQRGEALLHPSELRTLGRAYLAEQIHEAAEEGVRAAAWLPIHTGVRGLVEGVSRFQADLVVVPEIDGSASMMDRVMGREPDALVASLTVPALVVGDDGAPHVAPGWRIDGSLSSVSFTAHQLGILPVRGRLPDFAIELQFDEADPARSSIFAVIRSESVTTGLGIRDAQLRGPGFLDVERFPEIRFTSLRIASARNDNRIENSFTVEGDLEIKGFARLVELHARIMGPEVTAGGQRKVRFRATTTIDWREWGIPGRWFVEPELEIAIDVAGLAQANGHVRT